MAIPKEGLCRTCKEVNSINSDGQCPRCHRNKWYAKYRDKHRAKLNRYHRVRRRKLGSIYLKYLSDRRKKKISSMNKKELSEFRNKESKHTKIFNKKLVEQVIEHYGNKCVCCGETELLFLTIDHKNNDGAKKRKTQGQSYTFYRWIQKNGYPSDLQLLCRNCNWGKYVNDGICPHKQPLTTIPEAGVEPSGSKRHTPFL
jgi:hypothetical protein